MSKFLWRYRDLVVSCVALLVLSPILLVAFLLIRAMLGSPVLFQQIRPGIRGIPFNMYKFRSMTDERDNNGALLPDEIRLTKFGLLLRSTSIDELPALYNVLKGDMSLVGPRPLLMEYLPRYSERQARRHEVLPGITGWAQINGRNAITWEQKFDYDVWYVENQSFLLDLRILYLTLFKVLKRQDVTELNGVTMSKFQGTRPETNSSKKPLEG